MPFVTEEIYHRLKEQKDDLCIKQFEKPGAVDAIILQQGELLKQTITAIRDARTKNKLKPRDPIILHVQAQQKEFSSVESILTKQAGAKKLHYVLEAVAGSITVIVGTTKIYVETAQELNNTAQKEQLQKDLIYQQDFLISVEKKLSNDRFVQNAKPEIVDAERKKKSDAEEKIKALEEGLAGL